MFDVWTEKYRPKKIMDIVGQDPIAKRLLAYVKEHNIPNLLFAGPAGTGKTTAAIALANELYPDEWKQNFLELNASDERGIKIVRDKIKNFAKTSSFSGGVNFKIIFLDESDALTSAAQHALRRTMEKYTLGCRFIMSCNYSSKIIDPIQSRCAVFRFPKIEREAIRKHLLYIAKEEGVDVEDEGVDILLEYANGDMRKAITIMQAVTSSEGKVHADAIFKVFSIVNPGTMKKILEQVTGGHYMQARGELRDLIIKKGYSGKDIIKDVHREIFNMSVDDQVKMRMVDALAEFEFRMVEGSDELIQLEAMLAKIGLLVIENRN